MIHLAEKKNKAGESIPRVKTIFGLANKDDGHSLDHPPRVQNFGAGPKDVEFFLNDSPGAPSSSSAGQAAGTSSGKKKGKGGKGGVSNHGPGQNISQSGRYISVYEFFRTSKSMLSTNLISDDIGDVQQDWKLSGKVWQFYLETVSEYQSSPFPYRWNFATRWSIISTDESMAARGNCIDWTPPDPSSFKLRFHKARMR